MIWVRHLRGGSFGDGNGPNPVRCFKLPLGPSLLGQGSEVFSVGGTRLAFVARGLCASFMGIVPTVLHVLGTSTVSTDLGMLASSLPTFNGVSKLQQIELSSKIKIGKQNIGKL